MLISAAIVVEPLVISPHFPGFQGNEERLTALGLFPLCVALAYALRAVDARLRAAPWWGLGGAGLVLLVASLHYQLTTVGPQTRTQFILVELLAAAILAMLLAVMTARRTRRLPA